MNQSVFYGRSALLMTLGFLLAMPGAQAADNLRFHGALVAEPCVIPPGEEHITLDFGTVIDKFLYLNNRTHGQGVALHLTQCDLSLAKTVKVTFSGIENTALPGVLALSPGSQASGIAIGMETPGGKRLPMNKPWGQQGLVSGDNVLRLQAYVQAEPEARKHQSIQRGPFSAVATFNLEYE